MTGWHQYKYLETPEAIELVRQYVLQEQNPR
jgi:hypothetical protein